MARSASRRSRTPRWRAARSGWPRTTSSSSSARPARSRCSATPCTMSSRSTLPPPERSVPDSAMLEQHHHSPGFLAAVNDAKQRIRQISLREYDELVTRGDHHVLLDVREDHEWRRGHLPGAMHLGRGILERDVEKHFADKHMP